MVSVLFRPTVEQKVELAEVKDVKRKFGNAFYFSIYSIVHMSTKAVDFEML